MAPLPARTPLRSGGGDGVGGEIPRRTRSSPQAFSKVGRPPITSFRDGYDLVLVAALMGYARTETTRGYSLPTADDAQAAINSLLADR